jgi:uncharacterized protein YbbK (DUF523 family)
MEEETWGEFADMCPEVAGGLTIPRVPAEIVDGVVKNILGECYGI